MASVRDDREILMNDPYASTRVPMGHEAAADEGLRGISATENGYLRRNLATVKPSPRVSGNGRDNPAPEQVSIFLNRSSNGHATA